MTSSEDLIELQMQPIGPFRSPFDEAAFFEWLDKIKCIKRYEGRGHTLFIYVRPSDVDEDGLTELLAVFYRYNIDMKQLSVFDRDEFKGWFRQKKGYWYEQVFGKKEAKKK